MDDLDRLMKKQRKIIKHFDQKLKLEEKRLEMAQQISKARTKVGFTQKKLAQKLKTTQSVVSRIENGNQNITLDLLCRIANILEKDVRLQLI